MAAPSGRHALDRRSVLRIAGSGLIAGSVGPTVIGSRVLAASGPGIGAPARSPDDALAGLKEGNARYISNPQLCDSTWPSNARAWAGKQAPWATILSCADSRVPPELIFGGLGLGEVFVARNAGNLADTATIGTLEYGAAVLGSPLIVVLGHSRCGAVKAACEVVTENATFPGSIGPMIDPIIPAALAVRSKGGDFVDNTTRESAQRTVRRLADASSTLSGLVEAGKLKIVAAHYDLGSGEVEYVGVG